MSAAMTLQEQRAAAKRFVERWKAAEGNEDREARSFWIELLHDVLGISNPTRVLDFERRVKGRKIDVFHEDMGALVEAKSRGVDLDKQYQRGTDDGGAKRMVTPYEQAKWYADNLPGDVRPRWVVTCNFDELRFHDLYKENPESDFVSMALDELPDQLRLLSMFTDKANSTVERERRLSYEAGVLIGRIYDELLARYAEPEDPYVLHSLSVLCVRLVFCLYAEDSGLFGRKSLFYDFLKDFDAAHLRAALRDLFRVLDTPEDERDPDEDPKLLAFPYVNGGLFEEDIRIPQMDESLRVDILLEASKKLNWSELSPTVFGAMFESSIAAKTRHENGMHYTSVENIHKVIDPLLLEGLTDELRAAEGERVEAKRLKALHALQDKLAGLTFLDPAMGSGNFLTETYLSLRKMENRILTDIAGEGDQTMLAFGGEHGAIKVSIKQFFGIEIQDFAARVARTALWIAESQMFERTRAILPDVEYDVLPLKSYDNLVCSNALRTDWSEVLPASECDYIIGNPPFLGARNQNDQQKAEVMDAFGGAKSCGNVDYVAAWYARAADYMAGHPCRCAFVSTNSICQGEQVAAIWNPLFNKGCRIDFAHDTFRWDNEANDKAHVFCVIVGFSKMNDVKRLYHHERPDSSDILLWPKNINAYLADAPDAFVSNRSNPLCDVPRIGIGNKPIDGGLYLFDEEDKKAFLEAEPASSDLFHPWVGSNEFLNGKRRWVLWLGDVAPARLLELPKCRERVHAVREYRRSSGSAPTKKLAETPTRFHVENMPKGNSIVIPKVSSERRRYIPMGFVDPETLCSDLVFLIPDATLYHFGVLQSQMHNAWMRVVCGRLKSDYRYSGGVVYNNFPWPDPAEGQRAEIEHCAQAVLDARDEYPGCTLAEMYDPDMD